MPLLGAHFLSLHDKNGSGGGLAVGSSNPGEKSAVESIHIHCGFHGADRRKMSCCYKRENTNNIMSLF